MQVGDVYLDKGGCIVVLYSKGYENGVFRGIRFSGRDYNHEWYRSNGTCGDNDPCKRLEKPYLFNHDDDFVYKYAQEQAEKKYENLFTGSKKIFIEGFLAAYGING